MQQQMSLGAGGRAAASRHTPSSQASDGTGPVFGGAVNQLYDQYDPMLDADPFGLSASMHFPTQFNNYQQGPGR